MKRIVRRVLSVPGVRTKVGHTNLPRRGQASHAGAALREGTTYASSSIHFRVWHDCCECDISRLGLTEWISYCHSFALETFFEKPLKEESVMKRAHSMILAAVMAAGGTVGLSQGVTFAQAATADPAKQQQAQQKEQAKEERQAEKAARRAQKAEREELANMPKPAREALVAQVGQGTNPDYYKIATGEQHESGAGFKDAAGESIDVLVDRTGKLISRQTTAQAKAAAAAAPAAAPAPAAPAAPATPVAAAAIQPGQGVGLEQIPAAPQAVLRDQVKGAHDIRFYRAMFGSQAVWEAKYTTADGKDMAVRVDDAGKIVNSKALDADEKGRTEVKFDSMPATVKDHFRDVTKGHEGAQ